MTLSLVLPVARLDRGRLPWSLAQAPVHSLHDSPFVYQVPVPLAVGQHVTAFHPLTRSLAMGCILTRDLVRGIYRVQFDRPELGVHRCMDTDILVRGLRVFVFALLPCPVPFVGSCLFCSPLPFPQWCSGCFSLPPFSARVSLPGHPVCSSLQPHGAVQLLYPALASHSTSGSPVGFTPHDSWRMGMADVEMDVGVGDSGAGAGGNQRANETTAARTNQVSGGCASVLCTHRDFVVLCCVCMYSWPSWFKSSSC